MLAAHGAVAVLGRGLEFGGAARAEAEVAAGQEQHGLLAFQTNAAHTIPSFIWKNRSSK